MRAIISHKDYHLLRVEPDQVDEYLPSVRDILQQAVPYTGGFETIEQMVDTMRQGARPWQLWIMLDGDKPVGGFFSTIERVGPEILFTFEILAGPAAKEWILPLIGNFEQYLVERYGVTRCQIVGRYGWARFLRSKGYEIQHVITAKKLTPKTPLNTLSAVC